MTNEQLIKELQKHPKDATVRIYHETLCPDADFYVREVEYDVENVANEVTLYIKQE